MSEQHHCHGIHTGASSAERARPEMPSAAEIRALMAAESAQLPVEARLAIWSYELQRDEVRNAGYEWPATGSSADVDGRAR